MHRRVRAEFVIDILRIKTQTKIVLDEKLQCEFQMSGKSAAVVDFPIVCHHRFV